MSEQFVAQLEIATPEDMHEFGLRLGKVLQAGDTVLLTGELGAGKTTLTRGIGEGLGVRGPVSSPTFVLARTHPSLASGPQLVHVDAYRLSDSAELEDLDIDFAVSVVVAEWGAGLIDPADVALEVLIERPLGAGGDASETEWDPAEALVAKRTVSLRSNDKQRWQAVL